MLAAVAGLAGSILLWIVYSSIARGFDLNELGKMPERSTVLDVRGRTMGRLFGENRIVVEFDQVSPNFVAALLAREDDRFYKHGGVDFIGIGRAMVRNLKDRRFTQGASTITMQLARNSFPDLKAKSLHRKLVEIALARRLESHFTKEQLLGHYVNRIFFGNGIYGVERASQAYFGKPAAKMTLDESALLAGIIRGPNKFSPFAHPDEARGERDVVLDRMVSKGRLTSADAAKAKAVKTKIQPPPDTSTQESYALDAVRRDLDRVLDTEDQEDGGLRIHTTLDLDLQAAAEKSLASRLLDVEKTGGYDHPTKAHWDAEAAAGRTAGKSPDYLQGAVTVIDNASGGIVAIVGGRDFHQSRYSRAMQSERQVGSTFKPFVYAAAIEQGMFPTTLVDDGPITLAGWSPKNSDGGFGGLQPIEYGLYKSRNTMTARVGDYAGIDKVLAVARQVGLGEIESRSPQVFIGNLGAKLRDLTSAYSVFPNAGIRNRPFTIQRIENAAGEVLFLNEPAGYRALSPGASYLTTKMMEKVLTPSGTGAYARSLGYKGPAAGKTGTTDAYKDAWFVGFNRRLTCGVWVGMDQPEKIASQGYGSKLALPVWVDVMKTAQKLGYPEESPLPDVPTERVEVCAWTSRLATTGCRNAGKAVELDIPVDLIPNSPCPEHPGWREDRKRSPGGSSAPSRSLWDAIRGLFR